MCEPSLVQSHYKPNFHQVNPMDVVFVQGILTFPFLLEEGKSTEPKRNN